MRFKGTLLVTSDMIKAREFYSEVLGLETEHDFGANVALTGGIYLQTKESWREFIGKPDGEISFFNNDAELYFEEEDFDGFSSGVSPPSGMCIRYLSIGGGKGFFGFTTRTDILLRLVSRSLPSAADSWRQALRPRRRPCAWMCLSVSCKTALHDAQNILICLLTLTLCQGLS